jgi:DNA-binding NarL/FixJ family response regulator
VDGLTTRKVDVVGRARDPDEALEVIDACAPDVAVLDIRLPPTFTDEGLGIAEQVRSRYPEVALLVLSSYAEVAYAEWLLSMQDDSRAIGYLLKERVGNLSELVEALQRVASGEVLIDSYVIDRLMKRPRNDDPLDTLGLPAMSDSQRRHVNVRFSPLSPSSAAAPASEDDPNRGRYPGSRPFMPGFLPGHECAFRHDRPAHLLRRLFLASGRKNLAETRGDLRRGRHLLPARLVNLREITWTRHRRAPGGDYAYCVRNRKMIANS